MRTRWRLFQKRVVCTKLDIYVFTWMGIVFPTSNIWMGMVFILGKYMIFFFFFKLQRLHRTYRPQTPAPPIQKGFQLIWSASCLTLSAYINMNLTFKQYFKVQIKLHYTGTCTININFNFVILSENMSLTAEITGTWIIKIWYNKTLQRSITTFIFSWGENKGSFGPHQYKLSGKGNWVYTSDYSCTSW